MHRSLAEELLDLAPMLVTQATLPGRFAAPVRSASWQLPVSGCSPYSVGRIRR